MPHLYESFPEAYQTPLSSLWTSLFFASIVMCRVSPRLHRSVGGAVQGGVSAVQAPRLDVLIKHHQATFWTISKRCLFPSNNTESAGPASGYRGTHFQT